MIEVKLKKAKLSEDRINVSKNFHIYFSIFLLYRIFHNSQDKFTKIKNYEKSLSKSPIL